MKYVIIGMHCSGKQEVVDILENNNIRCGRLFTNYDNTTSPNVYNGANYELYSDKDIKETSALNKMMTWYGISIRTINDSSNSKISEMLIQGLNMGIIEGKKLVNNNEIDKCIYKLIEDFVDMQERYVEEFKEFL